MFCSQCGNDVANGAAACPRCGAPVHLAAGAPQPSPRPGGPGMPGAAHAPAPAFKFEVSRWTRADQIAGGATLLLFISLFLPWFGVSLGALGDVSGSGLSAHGYLYLTLILSLAIFAYLVMVAGFERLPFALPLSHEQVLLGATGVNFVLVLIAFVFKPGGFGAAGVGWRFGAFVGLIAAIAAVAPLAVPAIQARRAHT